MQNAAAQGEIRLPRSTPAGLKVGAWPISCVLYYPIFSADLWLSHSVLSSELFITAGDKKKGEGEKKEGKIEVLLPTDRVGLFTQQTGLFWGGSIVLFLSLSLSIPLPLTYTHSPNLLLHRQ